MNSFDLMIEKYSKELIETGKRSIMTAVKDENESDFVNVDNNADFISVSSEITNNGYEAAFDKASSQQNVEVNASQGSGRLKIQTFAADGVYPVVAANVKVFKTGEIEPYFEGYTDASGIIDGIILPAPVGVDTDLPPETEPFFKYNIEITHPKFITKKYKNVPVFDNINSVQTARLIPVEAGVDEESEIFESENENLMKRVVTDA